MGLKNNLYDLWQCTSFLDIRWLKEKEYLSNKDLSKALAKICILAGVLYFFMELYSLSVIYMENLK
ncbi:hypothetical protein SPSIL_013230 [Sporomusa silvacetica DSM 10669]|uniref:Uncharacterized protein n=1 Tax=Sporomusa silvacetica DSM 10669 TaxID=1123289 RepID=A0ABZ3IHS0_9FIRM|nr:hypothetical protein SPSIL_36400 [Sporomusa silvacetica DSM 10669]